MKKGLWNVIFLLSLSLFMMIPWQAFGGTQDFKSLLHARRTTLWIEGMPLGDMMVGSRGKIEFIWVDKALLDGAKRENSRGRVEWFQLFSRHLGNFNTHKKDLFLVLYESFKPWEFSPLKISVDGVGVTWEDVMTNKALFLWGDLPSGVKGEFGLGVPKTKGNVVTLAFVEYSTSFTKP